MASNRSRKGEKKNVRHAVWIIVLVFVLVNGLGLYAALPALEREALIALYNTTNGDNWTTRWGWKEGTLEPDGFGPVGSESSWYGIYVSGDHVTKIDLRQNNMAGVIPSELSNLNQLVYLNLSFNQLCGIIPSEFGKLSQMRSLILCYNQLSGRIPPELGNLSQMEHLSLFHNNINGAIPAELGNLSQVKSIFLDGNHLSGNIPLSLLDLTSLYDMCIDYNALHTNNDELRNFLNSLCWGNWEDKQTITPSGITALGTSYSSIRVSWTPISYISHSGSYWIYYSTQSGGPWKHAGFTTDKTVSYFEMSGLNSDTWYYFKIKTHTEPHGLNQNTVFSEFSEVVTAVTHSPMEEQDPPIGYFDTPISGVTVSGSIAVTGWALDDSGIDNLKIYREFGSQLVYIGDAVFVKGARPDVAAAYPTYPANTKAGWGYMLLTNFLPNKGNGTFVLHAIATDVKGKTTTLGTKTIHCDNDNAVKPFGAIDTPAQGRRASGFAYYNYGWALTPQPNIIPTDGSTINVFIDGKNMGNPVYNKYRKDIATLFPGYANSLGAVGYFIIDTTQYSGDVHTIAWSVTDDADNTDGVGSRYFIIFNDGPRTSESSHLPTFDHERIKLCLTPITVKKGFQNNQSPATIMPNENGVINIKIKPMQRIVIDLIGASGVKSAAAAISPLPIGSILDKEKGIFYWLPGPGFKGMFNLAFMVKDDLGNWVKRIIDIEIVTGE
jgi:Leucine rich repeat